MTGLRRLASRYIESIRRGERRCRMLGLEDLLLHFDTDHRTGRDETSFTPSLQSDFKVKKQPGSTTKTSAEKTSPIPAKTTKWTHPLTDGDPQQGWTISAPLKPNTKYHTRAISVFGSVTHSANLHNHRHLVRNPECLFSCPLRPLSSTDRSSVFRDSLTVCHHRNSPQNFVRNPRRILSSATDPEQEELFQKLLTVREW